MNYLERFRDESVCVAFASGRQRLSGQPESEMIKQEEESQDKMHAVLQRVTRGFKSSVQVFRIRSSSSLRL